MAALNAGDGSQILDRANNFGNEEFQRVQKILSACGVASRRESERLITAGRVSVNGVPATLGQSARLGRDDIVVDGVPLKQVGELVYIMLNKPLGYITTMRDDRGRKTVADLVKGLDARVYPIGRLDMNTEGLLLMTNDGQFAQAVAHPSYNITKTYEARVRGDAARAAFLLRQPMEVDSHVVHAVSVELTGRTADVCVLQITINEGRNRQLRKMCAQCGLELISLKRLTIASLGLGTMKTGEWRRLTDEERRSLMNG
ncbi:MAG: rRNA pseudouridine synthase [Oscillospiraceae bacterium]|nr:rRNA pseudouridine synthase [Oscillospiraceae bacterium]